MLKKAKNENFPDSPYFESFDKDEGIMNTKNDKINPMLESYYPIFYDLNWYLGRVIDFPHEGLTMIMFLKQGLGETYEWPVHNDIQVIQNQFIFYGPVKLIENGSFQIGNSCRRRIIVEYNALKSK